MNHLTIGICSALIIVNSAMAAPVSGDWSEPATIEQARNAVVIVRAGNRSGTGFLWQTPTQIVTALHVVGNSKTQNIIFELPTGRRVGQAKTKRILSTRDLALLELLEPKLAPDETFVFGKMTKTIKTGQKVTAVGFRLQLLHPDPTYLTVRDPCVPLEKIVLPSDRVQLSRTKVLQPDMPVINMQGPLVPGLSGCPVVNKDFEIIGIGHGGLDSGRVDSCWAILGSDITNLMESKQTLAPGSLVVPELFAAEADYFTEIVKLDPTAQRLDVGGSIDMKFGGSGSQEALFGIFIKENGYLSLELSNRNQRGRGVGYLGRSELVDVKGTLLESCRSIGPGGTGKTTPIPVSKGRFYFLRMKPHKSISTVSFRVVSHFIPLKITGRINNTRETPEDISDTQTIRDTVGFGRNSEDWYRIKMPSDGTFCLEIENLSPRGTKNATIGTTRIEKNTQKINVHYMKPSGKKQSKEIALQAGDVLLFCIKPYKDIYAAEYRLTWFH